jgi:tyrosyl-tRNA synthetase
MGSGLFEELTWRGLVHQLTDPALGALLDGGALTAYIGFDPTSASLTIGNLQQIVLLMRLQRAGHRPIALTGGGTGMIGDPSGKSDERNLLGPDELAGNLAGIRSQLERFLDFTPAAGASQALLVDNGEWLGAFSLMDFLRDVGKHFTVNAMIAKESVRARLEEREHGISFTEFTYMLLQAYDFLHLFDAYGCSLQLGGSDQWGNITLGVDLIRRRREGTAYGLTSPLVLKPDGTKFGKSEQGNLWLDSSLTSPYELYQFLVRSEDTVVGDYLRRLTFLDRDTISSLDEATASHPERREAQRVLAHEVTALVHGEEEAVKAARAAEALFSEEVAGLDEATLLSVFADAPSTELPRSALDPGVLVVDALVESGLETSKGAARRAVEGGGAYVNNRRVVGADAAISRDVLLHDRYVVLRRGKKDHRLLRFV